jgi:hypothetical protein
VAKQLFFFVFSLGYFLALTYQQPIKCLAYLLFFLPKESKLPQQSSIDQNKELIGRKDKQQVGKSFESKRSFSRKAQYIKQSFV